MKRERPDDDDDDEPDTRRRSLLLGGFQTLRQRELTGHMFIPRAGPWAKLPTSASAEMPQPLREQEMDRLGVQLWDTVNDLDLEGAFVLTREQNPHLTRDVSYERLVKLTHREWQRYDRLPFRTVVEHDTGRHPTTVYDMFTAILDYMTRQPTERLKKRAYGEFELGRGKLAYDLFSAMAKLELLRRAGELPNVYEDNNLLTARECRLQPPRKRQ